MRKQTKARGGTKDFLRPADHREVQLREDIEILQAAVNSAKAEGLPNEEIAARENKLKKVEEALEKLLKPKHDLLGLAEDEELGVGHLVKNLKQLGRQKKEGIKALLSGAIQSKILTSDPMISNLWTGALFARDLMRGRKEEEDELDTGSPIRTPSTPLTNPTGDSPLGGESSAAMLSLLTSIDYSTRMTFRLLDWVHNYRRFHRREIRLQQTQEKEARTKNTEQLEIPFSDEQRIDPTQLSFDFDTAAKETITATKLSGLPQDWNKNIITPEKKELITTPDNIITSSGIITPSTEIELPKIIGSISEEIDKTNQLLRGGLYGSPAILPVIASATKASVERIKSLEEFMNDEMPKEMDFVDQTQALTGIQDAVENLKASEETLREQKMLWDKLGDTGIGKATQLSLPGMENLKPEGMVKGIAKESLGHIIGSFLMGTGTSAVGLIPRMLNALKTGIGPALKGAGRLLISGPGLLVSGLIMAVMDGIKGFFASANWGTSKVGGIIGGILAGTGDRKLLSAFANVSKWAGVGAGIGSFFPVVGTIAGGLIGGAIGILTSIIGGKNIAKATDGLGRWVATTWEKLVNWVKEHLNPFKWFKGGMKESFTPTITKHGVEGDRDSNTYGEVSKIGSGITYNPSDQGKNLHTKSIEQQIMNMPQTQQPLVTVPFGANQTNITQNNNAVMTGKPNTVNPVSQKFALQ